LIHFYKRIVSDHKYFQDAAQVLGCAKPGGQVHWIPAGKN